MMRAVRISDTPCRPHAPEWTEAQVARRMEDGRWRLDDGRAAQRALSCLIEPMPGDRVLVAAAGDDECYVVHVLARGRAERALLSVPGASALTIAQARIDIGATERVAIRSLRDVEVSAVSGVLALNARNLFATVSDSLVENARHYVGRIGDFLLDVSSLLRAHGKQALVTAEEDIKMDAKRISMG